MRLQTENMRECLSIISVREAAGRSVIGALMRRRRRNLRNMHMQKKSILVPRCVNEAQISNQRESSSSQPIRLARAQFALSTRRASDESVESAFLSRHNLSSLAVRRTTCSATTDNLPSAKQSTLPPFLSYFRSAPDSCFRVFISSLIIIFIFIRILSLSPRPRRSISAFHFCIRSRFVVCFAACRRFGAIFSHSSGASKSGGARNEETIFVFRMCGESGAVSSPSTALRSLSDKGRLRFHT